MILNLKLGYIMKNFKFTFLISFFVTGFSFANNHSFIYEEGFMVIGCMDVNAVNYNIEANEQEEDEWGNIVCTYLSCDEVPYNGCRYPEAFSPWHEFFTPADCINYGGIPCEGFYTCDSCAYNEVCISGICQEIAPLNSTLPILYINTENQNSINSNDTYVLGTVTVEGGLSVKSDSIISGIASLTMKIRGRGNSTWELPKKPYQMKLDDKAELLDMPDDKKWIFLAEYCDKTMLRNTIAFEMGYSSVLDWTPKGEFAEVYINGEYNGTYNITQKVEEKSNRVDIGNDGFLLEIDQLESLDEDDHYISSNHFPVIKVKEPNINSIIENDGVAVADSAITKVSDFINEFESILFGNNFTDSINGYAKYIDVESFIDWFLINEITKNVDSKNYSSIYFNVILDDDNNGKIKMGPLWDFDISFGNNNYSDCEFTDGWWVRNNQWISRLFEDIHFQNLVKVRFVDHFYSKKDTILDKITNYSNALLSSAVENDNQWSPYLGSYIWPNPIEGDVLTGNSGEGGYLEAVNYMANWYTQRMEWLNQNLAGEIDIYGCLDENALNYNPSANFQEQDQWANILCTFESCNDVPSNGCMYANGFAGWNNNFDANDCTNYGGTPCEQVIEFVTTEQVLYFPTGWSIFSTYMYPENMSMDAILEPIVDNVVIVKDYLGSAYLPEFNFNIIGNIEVGEGYYIKTNNSENLIIEGVYEEPEENPIELFVGWNLFGYLRLEPADATAILSDLHSTCNVLIVKDYLGNVYLPEWGFNNIGNLEPGNGYHIKLSNEGPLTYISNNDFYRNSSTEASYSKITHLAKVAATDNNMTIVIEDSSWDIIPKEGSEIGAYDSSGNLVCSAVYSSPVTVLTLWGADATTTTKDGLVISEAVSFKLWSNNQAQTFKVSKWLEGANYYDVNAINVASTIITTNIVSEVIISNRELVRIINVLGQEVPTKEAYKGEVLFNVYNDGTIEKRIK